MQTTKNSILKKTTLSLLLFFTCSQLLLGADGEEDVFHSPKEGNLDPNDPNDPNDDDSHNYSDAKTHDKTTNPETQIDTDPNHNGVTPIDTTLLSNDQTPIISVTQQPVTATTALEILNILNKGTLPETSSSSGILKRISTFFKRIFNKDYKLGIKAFDNSSTTQQKVSADLNTMLPDKPEFVKKGLQLRTETQITIVKAVIEALAKAESAQPPTTTVSIDNVMQDPDILNLIKKQSEYLDASGLEHIMNDVTDQNRQTLIDDLGLNTKKQIQDVLNSIRNPIDFKDSEITQKSSKKLLSTWLKGISEGNMFQRNVLAPTYNYLKDIIVNVLKTIPQSLRPNLDPQSWKTPNQIIKGEWIFRVAIEQELPELIKMTVDHLLQNNPSLSADDLIAEVMKRSDINELRKGIEDWKADFLGLIKPPTKPTMDTPPSEKQQAAEAAYELKLKNYNDANENCISKLGLDIDQYIENGVKKYLEKTIGSRIDSLVTTLETTTSPIERLLDAQIIIKTEGSEQLSSLQKKYTAELETSTNLLANSQNLSESQKIELEKQQKLSQSLLNATDIELVNRALKEEPTNLQAQQQAKDLIAKLLAQGLTLEELSDTMPAGNNSGVPEFLRIINRELSFKEFKTSIENGLQAPKATFGSPKEFTIIDQLDYLTENLKPKNTPEMNDFITQKFFETLSTLSTKDITELRTFYTKNKVTLEKFKLNQIVEAKIPALTTNESLTNFQMRITDELAKITQQKTFLEQGLNYARSFFVTEESNTIKQLTYLTEQMNLQLPPEESEQFETYLKEKINEIVDKLTTTQELADILKKFSNNSVISSAIEDKINKLLTDQIVFLKGAPSYQQVDNAIDSIESLVNTIPDSKKFLTNMFFSNTLETFSTEELNSLQEATNIATKSKLKDLLEEVISKILKTRETQTVTE